MSDAEEDVDAEETPDPDDATGDGDMPDIDAEEFADLDALADEVEEEAGAASDAEEDDVEDGGVPDSDDAEGADGSPAATGTGETWGDMYVGTLTTVSNALIEEFGVEGAEEVEEDLARQLHLDEHFNEFMETRGKSDMPPEQALLLGSFVFLAVVVGTKTELPQHIVQEAEI